MSWIRWVEVITGVSVVVSLVVLIIEVRSNTLTIERQMLIDNTDAPTEPFLEDPYLMSAWAKVTTEMGASPGVATFMEVYGLTLEESWSYSRFLRRVWEGIEANFEYGGPSERLATQIPLLLSFEDNRLYWESFDRSFSPEFGEYVESLR